MQDLIKYLEKIDPNLKYIFEDGDIIIPKCGSLILEKILCYVKMSDYHIIIHDGLLIWK